MSGARPELFLNVDFGVGGIHEILQPYARNDVSIIIQRGTSQLVTTGYFAEVGFESMTLDDLDRRFDPLHTSGPYTSGGVSGVARGNPAVGTIEWNATSYPAIVGQVDDWPQEIPNAKDQTVPIRISDGVAALSRANFPTRRVAEWSGERILAIATAAGWTGPIAISRGHTRVGPLDYGQISAWTHMQAVAQAELGDLYVDSDGTLVFRDLNLVSSEARSTTAQAVYSDTPGGGEFGYTSVERATMPIVNDATISFDAKGNQRNAQDATSIAASWGYCHQDYSLPIATPSQAQQYVNWVVSRYKDPLHTFSKITWLLPASFGSSDLFEELLSRKLSDMVRIQHQPMGGGSEIDRLVWIRGIRHEFSGSNWIKTEFVVQDATWIVGLAHFDISTFGPAGTDVFF